jgi:hypothetical protein
MTQREALGIYIADAIRPPQIDYISPAEKAKIQEAERILNLPANKEWLAQANKSIEDYYDSGAAELDAKF